MSDDPYHLPPVKASKSTDIPKTHTEYNSPPLVYQLPITVKSIKVGLPLNRDLTQNNKTQIYIKLDEILKRTISPHREAVDQISMETSTFLRRNVIRVRRASPPRFNGLANTQTGRTLETGLLSRSNKNTIRLAGTAKRINE